MYSNIFVPLDGSDLAEQILPDVEELAAKLGIEVVLFQAVQSLTETLSGSHVAYGIAKEAVEEEQKEATGYLEGVAARLRAKGLNARALIAEGPPARTLLHHIDDNSIVAMMTHGHSGIRRTLFGSVADEVMLHSHVPVLVRRPPNP